MRSIMLRCAPLSLFAGALFLLPAPQANARTYYVSTQGDDRDNGSKGEPWRTLQKAARTLKPGDTVLISDGRYPGGVRQSNEGLPGQPITYQAVNPGKVILSGANIDVREVFTVMESHDIVVDGITTIKGDRCGIWVASSDRVTVRNCKALNNGVTGIFTSFSNDLLIENNECGFNTEQHGIYVSNSADRPVLRGNVCHDNGRCGIQLNGDWRFERPALGEGGDGIIAGALIEGNVLYENGQDNKGAALNLLSVRDSLVRNNLLYHNEAGGISFYNDNLPSEVQWGSKNNRIVNNTVYFRAGEGRWCLSFSNGSTDNVAVNNILYGGYRGAYKFDQSSPFRADYNMIKAARIVGVATDEDLGKFYDMGEWQELSGNDLHSTTSNPHFISPGTAPYDFRLAAGSPSLGRGTSYPDMLVDILGDLRDVERPTLGAVENAGPPAAPINVELTLEETTAARKDVTVRWTAPTSGCRFIVKRSTSATGTYETVATDVSRKSWTDENVSTGKTYWYVVVAVSGGVESDESDRAKVAVE